MGKKLGILFIKILVVTMVFVTCISEQNVNGQTNGLKVRVGLEYKYVGVSSVPVDNANIAVGYEVDGHFVPHAQISSSHGFVMSLSNKLYVKIGEDYSSYETALQAATALKSQGYESYPALSGTLTWAVYSKGYTNTNDANSFAASVGNGMVLTSSARRMELTIAGIPAIIFENKTQFPQITATEDSQAIILGDRSYRGCVEFYGSGSITVINVVSIDEYLYGVVPSEMPSSWHMEALKAQSVSARTYAIARSGIHDNNGYELCDSTHCQVYKGFTNETVRTNMAVDQTAGVAIYYNGNAINASFYSSSGGVTESSENVWIETVPYLRSKPEIAEYNPRNWEKTYTLSDLTTLLEKNNVNIGSALNMVITGYTSSGRVSGLQIIGTNGTHTLEKERIRTFFSPVGGSLESRVFQIVSGTSDIDLFVSVNGGSIYAKKPVSGLNILGVSGGVVTNTGSITVLGSGASKNYAPKSKVSSGGTGTFLLIGKGYGHGVGMSQEGARSMAEIGYTYAQILNHYYTGVEIR